MIVNAGFQKTGVTSCGAALEQLGFRYRKASAGDRNDHIKGCEILHRLEGYDACGDFPYPFLLDEIKPDRVILTKRSSDAEWLSSLKRHMKRRVSVASRHYYFRDGAMRPDDELTRMYRDHNDWVRKWCMDNNVPIMELCWIQHGWEQLCSFTGQVIPEKEFPCLNKS